MASWYLVYTKANAEYVAAHSLECKGYEVYLPKVKSPRPRRGETTIPLFPSYVFVRLELDQLITRDLYNTPGVRTLVKFDGKPALVPDEIIAYIRQRVEQINEVGGLATHTFRPGQKVYIRSGPFEGLEAIFEGPLGPSERVWVLLHVLGALNRVQLPVEALAPLPTAAPRPKKRLPRRTRGRGRRIRGAPSLDEIP